MCSGLDRDVFMFFLLLLDGVSGQMQMLSDLPGDSGAVDIFPNRAAVV